MAMVMLVISVSPMLAPLAGSGVIAVTGWQGIFLLIAVAAVASLLLTLFVQPETLAREHRVRVNLRSLAIGTRTLFADPVFMGLTFLGAFAFASFFVFIASASFVYTTEFGLSPTGFSLAFALNAIGFFAASQFAAGLGQRFGARAVVLRATAGFAAAAMATMGLVAAGMGSLPVVVGGLLAANACLGLVIPTVMVMALDDHGGIAGLASSLGGTLQMLTGGLVTVAAGPFFDGTALPMLAAIAACGVVALALALLVPGRKAAAA
jgi:DHA1 family bicyclomycin/chloramphenicol resistance-like MFS transporter